MPNEFIVTVDHQPFHAMNGAVINSTGGLVNLADMLQDDPIVQIAFGDVPGRSLIVKFGRNSDCDQAASTGGGGATPIGRDIWDGGIAGAAAWVPPTAARIHNLASANNEDGGSTGGNTGALTVKVFGLDGSFAEQEETVSLGGITDAATINSYTMIYRMEVLTVGSAGRNLGGITATAAVDGTVTAKITADMNQSLMAIYQVPADRKGVIIQWGGDIHRKGGAQKFVDIFLMTMKFGGPWRVRDTEAFATDGTNGDTLAVHKVVEAKEYVKIIADPSADAQDIAGKFEIVMEDA